MPPIRSNNILTIALLLLIPAFHAAFGEGVNGRKANGVEKPAAWQADSTRKMAALLRKLTDEMDVSEVPWVTNDRRVALFRKQLEAATDFTTQMNLHFTLARELIADARNEEALVHLDKFEQLAEENKVVLKKEDRAGVRMARVEAFMRIGEIENCCANHNEDSCLFPLKGAAIYKHQNGPRKAIKLLEEQLAESPDDLTARWLLNVQYMTLGEYPGSVPKSWLLDPKLFESDYDIKRFPEVAATAGLDHFGLAGGCVVDDFDGDGFLDVMRSDQGFAAQLRFFHNKGDGTFADYTDRAGIQGIVGGLNLTSADFNNDGWLDVLVLRGGWLKTARFPKSLLQNNGDGTFTDVTEQAGLIEGHPTQTATWFDYDNDGWLDLFVGNESPTPDESHFCELFHNNQDGTFTECAIPSGIAVVEFVKGVASGDYNNDGRPDLFISQRGGKSNFLFRNDGPRDPANPKAGWKFTNVAKEAGVSEPMNSFPCWFFDYDNDGWLDIFVCGFAGGVPAMVSEFLGKPGLGENARLYRNNHDGTFTNLAKETGISQPIFGMGANFGDLDNDGWLDFYIGTGDPLYTSILPNRMFRNDGGRRFQDVNTSGGFGHLQKGHAIAFADINNDGQQDVYEVMGGAFTGDKYYPALYANPGHEGHWVTLQLEGVRSNRSAIGAKIKVIVGTSSGERSIQRTVCTGGSFGASPLRQEIGLGNAKSIKEIEIFWPTTGETQRIPGVPMDRFYKIKEGEKAATQTNYQSFQFRAASAPSKSDER